MICPHIGTRDTSVDAFVSTE